MKWPWRLHTWRAKGEDEDPGSYRRWWSVYPREGDRSSIGGVSLEATTNRHGFCGATVTFNDGWGDDDVKVHVSVPKVFSVFLGFDLPGWRWPKVFGNAEREFGIRARSGTVSLLLGLDDSGAANRCCFRRRWPREVLRDLRATGTIERKDNRHEYRRNIDSKSLYGRYLRWRGFLPEAGMEFTIFRYRWTDQLLGRVKVRAETKLEDAKPAVIAMPEGNYPCKVTIIAQDVGRARWPWSRKRRFSSEVDIGIPVPFPGKGENSYDCDDDATWSSHGPYSSVAQATAEVAAHVMSRRERYGSGQRWIPNSGWPEGIAR